jgi:hypothetical protein
VAPRLGGLAPAPDRRRRATTTLGIVGMVLFIQAHNPLVVIVGTVLGAIGVSP